MLPRNNKKSFKMGNTSKGKVEGVNGFQYY